MAWLMIDGHAAVWDDDPRITALIRAIQDRLAIHDTVFLSTRFGRPPGATSAPWYGLISGPEFNITRDTRIASPERVDDTADSELYKLLSSDGELRSPHFTFTFDGGGFTRWGASRMW